MEFGGVWQYFNNSKKHFISKVLSFIIESIVSTENSFDKLSPGSDCSNVKASSYSFILSNFDRVYLLVS